MTEQTRVETLIITISATGMGIIAGLLSYISIPEITTTVSILFMLGSTIISIGISRVLTEPEFSKKDYAFITFMAFSFWFITWTILIAAL